MRTLPQRKRGRATDLDLHHEQILFLAATMSEIRYQETMPRVQIQPSRDLPPSRPPSLRLPPELIQERPFEIDDLAVGKVLPAQERLDNIFPEDGFRL